MRRQLKMLPAFVMLLAGLIASVMTFFNKYTTKEALVILTITLIVFYILGLILQKVIYKFEKANEPEPEVVTPEEEEGKVSEKEVSLIPEVNSEEAGEGEEGE